MIVCVKIEKSLFICQQPSCVNYVFYLTFYTLLRYGIECLFADGKEIWKKIQHPVHAVYLAADEAAIIITYVAIFLDQ
jgi:hypothetical protein